MVGRETLSWFVLMQGRAVIGPLEAGVISSLMLICAVAASLAFGVLVAYGVCQVMFRIFRQHATAVAKERVSGSVVRVAIEG